MTRSKKPTQRRRATKPSSTPHDESSSGTLTPWEPVCLAATAKATGQLYDVAQAALDENERAYWAGVSELGLAHEAEDRALATS